MSGQLKLGFRPLHMPHLPHPPLCTHRITPWLCLLGLNIMLLVLLLPGLPGHLACCTISTLCANAEVLPGLPQRLLRNPPMTPRARTLDACMCHVSRLLHNMLPLPHIGPSGQAVHVAPNAGSLDLPVARPA